MTGQWKPEGYSSGAPYLMVAGAADVIKFLRSAFDATGLRRFDGPDGTVMHAEVRLDDTVVMLAEASAGWAAFPAWLHVYVQDVDATYRRAVGAGGIPVQEPMQKARDPDRRGGVKDPSGNTWWISTQVASGSSSAAT